MAEDNEKIIIEAEDEEFSAEEEKKNNIRVLAFSLSGESYCAAVKEAREVVALARITRVPNVPAFIAGVMNLRGEIIPVVDIRYFLDLNKPEGQEESRVIVTDISGPLIGVLVDEVQGTLEIPEDSIQPPLATVNPKVTEYTKGQVQIGRGITVFLELEKILDCSQMRELKKGG